MMENIYKNLKRTWLFTKGCKKYLFGCFVILILSAVVGVITPVLSAKQMLYINSSTWDKLLIITVVYFLFETIEHILNYCHNRLFSSFDKSMVSNLQTALAKQVLKLEIKELDTNSSGVFIDRINNDTKNLSHEMDYVFFYLINIATGFGVLVAVFVISKILFLYFILASIFLFMIDKIRIKREYEMDKVIRGLNEKNTGIINEMVRGVRDIKTLNAEESFLSNLSSNLKDANYKKYRMKTKGYNFMLFRYEMRGIFDILYIVLAISLVLGNVLSAENLLVVFMYRYQVYGLLGSITRALEEFKDFNLSANRVYEIFDNDKFTKEAFGNIDIDNLVGNIEFKNVTFGYEKRTKVLDKISFKIDPNQKVAFVGKSGAGKTTVFSLLSKMYNCKNGTILLDGYNINDLTKDSIRNNISIITQMPYIFNMSIKDNLRLVKKDASLKEIKKVCKDACLDKFIESLPKKYDTILGEGGVTLSGGQRQRLAIARTLLTKTKIILFDEATSALDNETQNEINKAIDNLKGEYTILIVAHRLSTVINCDKIFVIDGGKIIDSGTHKELMERCDFYKNLYESES